MKNKKTKIILVSIIFVIGISLIIIGVVLSGKQKEETSPNQQSPGTEELLGEERSKVQKEIIDTVESCLTEETKIKEYLEKKGFRSITMQELKDELKIDISAFENLKYGCDNNLTEIDYNEGYTEHLITLTCEALFKK